VIRFGVSAVRAVLARLRRFGRERIGAFRLLVAIRLVQWPVRALASRLSRTIRRDPRLIAFGATSNRFADNSAYLFLHMAASADMRCVWVSGSKETVEHVRSAGYEAVRRWSVAGIRVALRASWYVFSWYPSDVNHWLSDGAVTLNLWHGVGVKPVGRERTLGTGAAVHSAPDGSLLARLFAEDRRRPDWLLTTSPMMTDSLGRSFDVPPSRCIEAGYPRTDHLVEGTRAPSPLLDDSIYRRLQQWHPVVGYFPTFRDWSASLPGGAPMIDEMSAIVAAQGGTLVFKGHHLVLDVEGAEEGQTGASRSAIGSGPGLVSLPKDSDLNAYLSECDVLVTDYSSVASDFLFLKRPVILFVPDFDLFESTRGFLFDPKEMMPGVVTRTKDELYTALGNIQNLRVSDNTERLLDAYWSPEARGGSSQRIADFILQQQGLRTSSQRSAHDPTCEERSLRSSGR